MGGYLRNFPTNMIGDRPWMRFQPLPTTGLGASYSFEVNPNKSIPNSEGEAHPWPLNNGGKGAHISRLVLRLTVFGNAYTHVE